MSHYWQPSDDQPIEKRYSVRNASLLVGASLLLLGILSVGVWAARKTAPPADASLASLAGGAAGNYPLTPIDPGSLPPLVSSFGGSNSLVVNGQAQVTSGLVLTPSTAAPTAPITGEIYYDQAANRPLYYNGTAFVDLQGSGATTINNTFVTNNIVSGGGGGNFVSLQGSTPGTADAGNFNVSGTGTVGVLQASAAVVKGDSATTLRVQAGSGMDLLAVDTVNKAIVLGQDGTPTPITVRGGAAVGIDAPGADMTFDASNGTGSGGSGAFIFRTASGAGTAITMDSTSTTIDPSSAQGAITWSHTTGNQPNRLLIVGVVTHHWDEVATSVTYDGLPLTHATHIICGASNCGDDLWYLVNPPSGTFNVVATMNFAPGTGANIFAATTYYNVNQATPFGAPATATGANGVLPTINVSTSSATQVVVDVMAASLVGWTEGSGQTAAWNIFQTDTIGNVSASSSYKPATIGSTTLSWAPQGPYNDWAEIALPLNPVISSTPDPFVDRLHITATGNVGINNNNPQYALDVTGVGNFGTSVLTPLLDTATSGALTLGSTNATAISLGNATSNIATTMNGTVLVKPTPGHDSATAFEVQNASGTPLFTGDTTTMTVRVVSLEVSGTLAIGGHIVTSGTAPAVAAGAAACTAPTVAVSGNDTAGTITVTTGSGCGAAGVLATLTFSVAFGVQPHVLITPESAVAAGLQAYAGPTSASFTLNTSVTPASATTYVFDYLAVQ